MVIDGIGVDGMVFLLDNDIIAKISLYLID